MLFRQLFDTATSTYTYLLADEASGQAALIDPVFEQVERDLKLIEQLGFELKYVLDTHVHADHITAAGALRKRTGAQTVAGPLGAKCTDIKLAHGESLHLGELDIEILHTPGHTDDSVSYRVGANVFTGDALFIRGTGRTDFQNGSAAALYDSITKVLFALPADSLVWPGHDYHGMTMSTIAEEREHNPRVAGKTREEFITLMENLALPMPKRLNIAVPANRVCGAEAEA